MRDQEGGPLVKGGGGGQINEVPCCYILSSAPSPTLPYKNPHLHGCLLRGAIVDRTCSRQAKELPRFLPLIWGIINDTTMP